jgi:DnaJ homolog subfamily C member 17
LLTPFGETDVGSILLSSPTAPPKPGKKPKKTTAVVPFRQLGHAFAAVCASGRAEQGLEGIEVGWAEGKEPAVIGWLRARGALGSGEAQQTNGKGSGNGEGKVKAGLPQESSGMAEDNHAGGFSSFPASFVSCLLSWIAFSGTDFIWCVV